jgi:hypothetical protein
MSRLDEDNWIRWNPLTKMYDTKDGTKVCGSLYSNIRCLADVLYICQIRYKQRQAFKLESK